MGRPNQTHERLDALLDGRPGEVTDDLALLLAAAEALRTELAEFELDPEVVDRHLEQALDRPATVVPLPVRDEGRGGGLRRRLVAVGLAAALVLVPATAASAASSSALPGQPLYPVKIAFEQFRLATVQWSATAEAHERTRLAAVRLKELDKLIQLRMVRQIPSAIRALDQAVVAAHAAVEKAIAEEGEEPELVAAAKKLEAVKDAKSGELVALRKIVSELPPANQAAIKLAVQQSQVIAAFLPPVLAPAPATTAAPNSTAPPATPATTASPPPPPTAAPTTQPEPPPPPTTEAPPPTTEPATTATTPTTETPPTTAASQDQGNPSGAGGSGETPPSSGP